MLLLAPAASANVNPAYQLSAPNFSLPTRKAAALPLDLTIHTAEAARSAASPTVKSTAIDLASVGPVVTGTNSPASKVEQFLLLGNSNDTLLSKAEAGIPSLLSPSEAARAVGPQDLTVRPVLRAAATPAASGDVSVTYGDVATSGDYAPGISISSPGGLTIAAGTVTTSGNSSDGIDASAAGSLSIDVAGISTTGNNSTGIYATAGGDISITAGSISDSGTLAKGIHAVSYNGDISIDVGSVSTVAPAATTGIYALGHDVSITAGSVSAFETNRFPALGIYAGGIGADADVNVTVNDYVYAHGARAQGVVVNSGGTAEVTNNGYIGVVEFPGEKSNGGAINVYAGSDITITNNGTVSSGVNGIVAHSTSGNITISSDGKVDAYQNGIYASTISYVPDGGYTQNGNYYATFKRVAGGSVTIDANQVSGGSGIGRAIFAAGSSVDITISGGVSSPGYDDAVDALGYAGGVSIHNEGAISAANGFGIDAQAYGDVTIDGTGSVDAPKVAIGALSIGGSVSITQGDITGSVNAEADVSPTGSFLGDPTKSVSVDVNSVTTSATQDSAIVALNHNYYGSVSIKAGNVKTYGDYSAAIVAIAPLGTADVTADSVSTKGLGATAIAVYSAANVGIDVGSVTTANNNASGIEVIGVTGLTGGKVNVEAGSVTTAGNDAAGLVLESDSDTTVNVGSITTAGTGALGLYASAIGDATLDITAGTVATTGDHASGVLAFGKGGAIDVSSGTITTSGTNSAGIVTLSYGGPVSIQANAITTSGGGAIGIVDYAFGASTDVTAGSVATSGIKAAGMIVEGDTGVTINADTVTTSGDNANGIVARSGGLNSYGVGYSGNANITAGNVTVSGSLSAGIDVATAGSDGAAASDIAVKAGTVTASGDFDVGIVSNNNYGSTTIDASTVTALGRRGVGIYATASGNVAITAQNIAASAGDILVRTNAGQFGDGSVSIDLTGKIASAGQTEDLFPDAAVAVINQSGTTAVNVSSTGSVTAAGDAIQVQNGGGAVKITNAGTIQGGSGYAVDVSGVVSYVSPDPTPIVTGTPATEIDNQGKLIGAVRLSGGDDLLTNSGTWAVAKDSDFSGGNDLVVNSGTLLVNAGTTPGNVSMLGLDAFQNTGGLVDLRNGVAGDTLTLPGTYVGSNGARLGLDVGANGVADKLIVGGAATGSTTILINGSAANATLLSKSVTLVQAGAGTSATAFSIAGNDVGFVRYGLGFDGGTNSFQLTATAGSAVNRLAKATQAAQSIWQQSADAWSTHMAELRDGGDTGQRVWGQAYGKVDTLHQHAGGDNVGYRQDYYGFQTGVDLAGKQSEDGKAVIFGVTGGYLSSDVNFRAGAERLRFDTENLGGYASFRTGPFFANLLGQYDHYRINAHNGDEQWSDSFNGNGYGAQGEVGARFGGDGLFAEPVASLIWQKTDLGTLHALGQSIDFDNGSALTGKLGLRIGGTFDMGKGGKAVFYARAAWVHGFHGDGSALLESGGASDGVTTAKLRDHGEGSIGVNLLTTGRLSGFIEGDADAGNSYKGGGGRVGIRFKL
ncbi:beta strand repeat-containing protein [Sphingomonas oryzagri]|uniref:Autotransporter outer membrane beta-barrel domain-containing protein n=1 Tax=Sphingomonas oryzagri TaxID=3042314 RepID=A0ABT6MY00_9SPHN|nr:autotransporter outer membrane beta-barrel domain-containing protein [Sphingomonas oryzagri]MDH7637678.1 autotransporter outer membrane beta-barrel domain-containing protein [Sphingomonas oryzagri]